MVYWLNSFYDCFLSPTYFTWCGPWCFLQALTRTPLSSARTCHQPRRKKQRRRWRMGSWRSRRCWCSTWKTQKPSPYKWKERYLSSTPCSTWKPLQVEGNIHQNANRFKLVHFNVIYVLTQNSVNSYLTTEVFGFSGPGGCAVLCDSVRVQRCQLCQWGEEDVASGLVNWFCH